jgi:hypothetical protein
MAQTDYQPSQDELDQLLQLVSEANDVGTSAASMSAERLRKCVEAGLCLLRWKTTIPRGQWETWVDNHIPALTRATRCRWMQLAQLSREGKLDLDSARGLRHAYQLAQLLPEADSTGTKASVKSSYITHLARLVSSLAILDVDKMSESERNTLKQRLAPVVEVFTRL